jgi:hypothetical protein
MENLIYWQGKAVGRDFGSYTSFFPSAPPDAVAALSHKPENRPAIVPNPQVVGIVATLEAQLDAIPELATAVEALMKERTAGTGTQRPAKAGSAAPVAK